MRSNAYTQWYNENEGRAYPVGESASRRADDGSVLHSDVLVDIGIHVPPEAGTPYIGYLQVSSSIYTLTILAEDGSALLAGTYSTDAVEPYSAYPLSPVAANVYGWVVFGNIKPASVGLRYRFSGPQQSGLATKAVHTVHDLPVEKLTKYGGNPNIAASGLVRLIGGAGVLFESDPLDPNKIIVKLSESSKNQFASPCVASADRDACGVPPLRRINGVKADSDGRLILRFV